MKKNDKIKNNFLKNKANTILSNESKLGAL